MFVKGTPTYSSYDKVGRLFGTIGNLRSFITGALKAGKTVTNWQVVELELTVKDTKPIHEVVKADKLIKILKS